MPRYLEPASRRSRRAARRRRRRAVGLLRLGIAIALLAGLAYGAVALVRSVAAPSLDATGPKDGAVLGPNALAKLTFSAKGTAADLSEQRWTLDGAPVTPRARGGQLVYRPRNLADGQHRFQIAASGGFLGEAKRAWTFTVDTTAPKLRLDRPAVTYAWRPVVVRGTVNEPATLRASSKRIPVEDRRFRLRYATPPSGKVILTATDDVGNSSRWRVPITLVPREPAAPVRAVHVSADAWASTTLRQGVLQMIEQGRINAVELDLKDEAGVIGWPADVPAGKRYGAIRNTFDLRAAVRQLHAKGVRVIGRLVAFRDPIFAGGAWKAGRRDQVIQAPDGTQYSGYGGFSNFASPEVRRYNIAVAVEAAKAGVDDILYDYVRRPDGYIDTMVFPGLRGTPEKAIVDFLAETRRALRPYDTFLGASVFGIAATRPLEIAQDIPAMARQVDYVSPMVYPSHWAPGEYEVANPNAQPYDIVRRSLEDFKRKLRGTGARLVPWLQDFSIGITYGTAEVAAQIRATTDTGLKEFLLWDPTVTYIADAVPRTAKLPSVGTAKAQKLPADAPGLVALGSTSAAAAAPPQAGAGSGAGTGSGSAANPATVKANELGLVPVLMHHRVVPDRDSEYDLTPQEFRAELQRLWKDGFVPITAAALATGKIDVPAGKKPVVMTFDDGSPSQFALRPDGTVRPDTAVGIMLAFAQKHPDFTPAGTFYVNADPFALGANVGRGLRWLMQHGFEIGNHSYSHANLSQLDDARVQRELAQEARLIQQAVPGYKIRTMALPFGAMPANKALAVRGRSSGGTSYGPYAVMLVGANPAPSPFSGDFDAAAVPRIRSAQLPWRGLQENYAFDYWMKELEGSPGSVYVSDGNPDKISYPKSSSVSVAQRFQARTNPY